MSKKTLYILRHAKAETGGPGQDDHARILAERGARDAKHMGKYLAEHMDTPEKVLCSPAIRTVETLIKIEESYNRPLPVEYTEKLYLASGGEILNVIAHVPESVTKLMVLAHNPGLHQLVLKLAKKGDEHLLDDIALKFPTCAFAEIVFDDLHWRHILTAKGTLKAFVTPKGIE